MDPLERNYDMPTGGPASGGGGCYHLSFRSGSRAGGVSARSSSAYITRSAEYAGPERDQAIYEESGNMPAWAEDDPAAYWDAADLYERANGRLYVSADFALPRDIEESDQIELARDFARALTKEERLPYTLAVHAGRDDERHSHNPHAHLMFSERRNDGIERSREQWFRRANSQDPERGGAPKSRTFHGREWIERARAQWAAMTNQTLERCGRSERVDHRSYARQGLDRQPGEHYGPEAAQMVSRGDDHDRLERVADVADTDRALRDLDHRIASLETAKASIFSEALDEERGREPRDESGSRSAGRADAGWER
jgi:MobA/MobL family protein